MVERYAYEKLKSQSDTTKLYTLLVHFNRLLYAHQNDLLTPDLKQGFIFKALEHCKRLEALEPQSVIVRLQGTVRCVLLNSEDEQASNELTKIFKESCSNNDPQFDIFSHTTWSDKLDKFVVVNQIIQAIQILIERNPSLAKIALKKLNELMGDLQLEKNSFASYAMLTHSLNLALIKRNLYNNYFFQTHDDCNDNEYIKGDVEIKNQRSPE